MSSSETKQVVKTTSKKGKIKLININDANDAIKNHMSRHWSEIKMIESICKEIYKKFVFSGKEHHFQAALEEELRDRNIHIQQEIARTLHYKKTNGDIIQLPHDIRGREDLLLDKKNMIIELKQTGKLTDKEFNQICRYMHERKTYDLEWRTATRGMLINFGDNDLEVWYLFYNGDKIIRVFVCKEDKELLCNLVESYDASIVMG